MNLKLIALASAFAVSAAVAQDYEEDTDYQSPEEPQEEAVADEPEPTPAPAPAPAPAPVEEVSANEVATAAPAPVAGLNVLHGSAYNTVGNEAAASTVRGNMASPYKMNGAKLLYVEPSNQYGVLSLGGGAMTYLLAFDNQDGLGKVTAGVATKGFGVTVDVALDKKWLSNEVSTAGGSGEVNASRTGAGDYLGATFAMPLGAMDVTIGAHWRTYQNEIDNETETNENNVDYWDLGVFANLSNSPSGSKMAWNAGLSIDRFSDYRETVSTNNQGAKTTTESTGKLANLKIVPHFNFGMPVLSNENSRVLVGLNTRLPIVFFDELDNAAAKQKDSYSIFALYTAPNIFAEMALTENWIVFGGAAFDWEVFSYADDEFTDRYDSEFKTTNEVSVISMKTNATVATAGARFQYKTLSLEASIAQNLNTTAWSGLIGNFSGTFSF